MLSVHIYCFGIHDYLLLPEREIPNVEGIPDVDWRHTGNKLYELNDQILWGTNISALDVQTAFNQDGYLLVELENLWEQNRG